MMRFVRPATLAAATVLFAAASGCGEKNGAVTGTVTHKGKKLTSGSVTFFSGEKSAPVVADIKPDGRYSAAGVGVGTAKVGVYSPNPKIELDQVRAQARDKPGAGGEPPAVDVKSWFAIPDKYADPEKSGLTYPVKSGPNEIDIDLP